MKTFMWLISVFVIDIVPGFFYLRYLINYTMTKNINNEKIEVL